MSVSAGLKLATNIFVALLYVGKAVGDVHKHKGHEAHHQLCDCMGYCSVCIWESAFQRAKAKAEA